MLAEQSSSYTAEAINARHTCRCCEAIDIEVDRDSHQYNCRKCARHGFPCAPLYRMVQS